MKKTDMTGKTILITGAAGFIGSFLAKALFRSVNNITIIGMDNMNDYYDVRLKETRLEELKKKEGFVFIKESVSDKDKVMELFEKYEPDLVVHLAAQAGVRYSISHPDEYIQSNVIGFFNILEACRHSYDEGKKGVEHLVYASSSSVYGMNKKVPYATEDKVDHPASLYAATKKSNELMAYTYSKLYGIPSTGLRFFTVYGPLGRPDMAYFSFTDKLVKGQEIQLYNYGDLKRDFTYIDDVIRGIENVIHTIPGETEDGAAYHIYNIGKNKPDGLLYFVETLEKCLMEEGMVRGTSEKKLLPMQPGDVYQTYADVEEFEKDFGFRPETSLEEGLREFVRWYKRYYFSAKE